MADVRSRRFSDVADFLVLAIAVSLPWSTSATTVLIVLWLIALFPSLDLGELQQILKKPAGGVPILLWLLALIGIGWAFNVPMTERWAGFNSFHRLLTIPLLLVQFQRSDRAGWVAAGFIVSCAVLMGLSWLLIAMPSLSWHWGKGLTVGVPVKDYILQGAEFAVCAAALAVLAQEAWQQSRYAVLLALSVMIFGFVLNLIVIGGRTGIAILAVLIPLFAAKRMRWKGRGALLLASGLAAMFILVFVPSVRSNLSKLWNEVQTYQPEGQSTRAGERLEFWRKSVSFVAAAPVLGHGTGSIRDQFRQSAIGQSGMAALASSNPHSQILAMAIQLGLVGAVVLLAMWWAHLMLFQDAGVAAWIGLVIVVQNFVGSLFNSHLFDFTQGWAYVFGVGVAGGTVLKKAREEAARLEPASVVRGAPPELRINPRR